MKEFIIVGPPGTGKTTTVKNLVESTLKGGQVKPNQVALTSFTKAGAAELAGRGIPVPRASIGTLHSFAFRALGLEKDIVAESHIDDWNNDHRALQLSMGHKPTEIDDAGLTENPVATDADVQFSQYNILRARLVPEILWPHNVRGFGHKWADWKKLNGLYDFADMIELATQNTDTMPVHFSPDSKKWQGPKIIFGDEYQDFTKAERKLVDHWGQSAEMVVKVGDDDQTLYHFKGADPGAMDRPDLPDMLKRVLKQSHRVPQAVHEAAQVVIRKIKNRPDIEYLARPAQGSFTRLGVGDFNHPEKVLGLIEKDLAEGLTVGFMAPCGYMLRPFIALIRKQGIPYCNTYRASRGDWNPLKLSDTATTASQRLLAYLQPNTDLWGPDARMWTLADVQKWASILDSKTALLQGAKTALEKLSGPDAVSLDILQGFFQTEALESFLGITASAWGDLAHLPKEFLYELIKPDLASYGKYLMPSKAAGLAYPLAVATQQGPKALIPPYNLQVGTIHSFKGGQFDSVYIVPDLSVKGAMGYMKKGPEYDAVLRMFYVALTRAYKKATVLAPATGWAVRV